MKAHPVIPRANYKYVGKYHVASRFCQPEYITLMAIIYLNMCDLTGRNSWSNYLV